jgi:hypothetical protein
MNYKIILGLIMGGATPSLFAESIQSFYCPQGNALVKVGMTAAQVQSACGQPQIIQDNTNRLVQNVPVTRLTYNNINKGSVYFWNLNKVYSIFSLPSGSIITPLTVLIVDNKVKSINFNGNDAQSTGACAYAGSTSFQGNKSPTNNISIGVGDPINKVLSACGNPDYTDHSYMQVPISSQDKPARWIYKLDQYNPAYQLLFINGILEAIDK